jgi:hypothetical protein
LAFLAGIGQLLPGRDDEFAAAAATGETAPREGQLIQRVALDLHAQFASGGMRGEAFVAGRAGFERR